ncbi:hypothetical protein AZE42_10203 [Rhizopogon vesiculosus]|uniref:Uncharacterized protein n=1 Tax=Rhizopogon vesiculosus TaxID=180088 RepID=A0A1J8Q3M1_9AGAM|nr:hypothetical protein AZE42_10203 [Rhizopogon vesiculosus]
MSDLDEAIDLHRAALASPSSWPSRSRRDVVQRRKPRDESLRSRQ